MERENKPVEIKPGEPLRQEDDTPVIRLVSETSASEKNQNILPKRIERKEGENPRSFRKTEKALEPLVPRPALPDGPEHVWGSGHEGQKKHSWSRILIISLVGLLFTGLIIYAITLSSKKTESEDVTASGATTPASFPGTIHAGEMDAAQMVAKLEKSIRNYCKATTVDERAKYVRDPARVKPLMQKMYPDGKVPPIPAGPIQMDALTMDNRADFWYITLNAENGSTRNLIAQLPAKGPALVDWEVDVVYQPYPWEKFLQEAPSGIGHDFRVHANLDILYSHEFADDGKWRCYYLTTRDSETPVYGYCEAGGEIDKKLSTMIRMNTGTAVPVILHLKRPIGLGSPQGAIIEAITCENWIYLDPPHPGS